MPKDAKALVAEYQEIYAAAERDNRDLTASELAHVVRLVEQADEQHALEQKINSLGRKMGSMTPFASSDPNASVAGGPGDIFVASQGWKSIADPQSRGQTWTTGPVEVSSQQLNYQLKAGTVLESGQGGGFTPVPQVIPGTVNKLFEALSVVDLLPTSQATTSSLRYVNEGTATSAAAGVAEGGTKPASDLAYSTIDEPVKKTATVLTVSDELIDDGGGQVQQYLNSRLALFVSIEEERQVLRGASTNELVGLFGRAINTSNIGADTPAVGIYKALVNTRGSANLAPSGIVMHPVNYANIRRGTATTGEYLAGYRVLVREPGHLPGQPVGAARRAVHDGGFGDCADRSVQLGRPPVPQGRRICRMTNSHASYFQSNLLMIRAEQRMALAAFRPNAFTAVTGLGVAI